MRFREIITNKTIFENASAFAEAIRTYNEPDPKLTLCIYESGTDLRQLYQLQLTRPMAVKLIRELTAALDVQPYTPQEIAHHEAVVAERKAEGANI
jgi:hypothetical protein